MVDVVASNEAPRNAPCNILLLGAEAENDGPVLSQHGSELDRALAGELSNYLRSVGFKAEIGELVTMPGSQIAADTIGIVGLGPRDELGVTELRQAAGRSTRKLGRYRSIATTLHGPVDGADAETAVVEGMMLGSYHFDLYKTEPQSQNIEHITLLGASDKGVKRGAVRAAATILARDLINEPASTLNPTTLAERVKELAKERGLECTVWDENDLADRGFGGLLGVGRGSDSPPRLIQLHYSPDTPKGRVTLVGKGITFDSGGLSLKPPEHMEDMKTDMSGAAAVIGAMSALRDLGAEMEVSCIVPAAENMPSGKAIRPGDVIRHYGGKTSEVLNSDAEGRLVLADSLALASEARPGAIIDVATLTGSIVLALGLRAAGLFCENEALRTGLLEAAGSAGERFWWMPIFADYRKQLNSEVADIKNIATKWGGAIFAANFLKEFVAPGIPWAHLDIAGGARAEEDYDEVRKGGTGIATRTLMTWLEQQGVQA